MCCLFRASARPERYRVDGWVGTEAGAFLEQQHHAVHQEHECHHVVEHSDPASIDSISCVRYYVRTRPNVPLYDGTIHNGLFLWKLFPVTRIRDRPRSTSIGWSRYGEADGWSGWVVLGTRGVPADAQPGVIPRTSVEESGLRSRGCSLGWVGISFRRSNRVRGCRTRCMREPIAGG